ncbi:uncharacterized protein LOC126907553 isoform X2 [Daktulosphaira vitifoliae]|uniref:uncharacterized protein LOC126907553 isoform X2 n=1 Tax=Daktulosphaira vitifoliae TaxID=58002 RepID=UPI0021AA7D4E|nr:uncharacterized protein LOC126907553 isoform X2 [Daktulosphaira vitifoliae]
MTLTIILKLIRNTIGRGLNNDIVLKNLNVSRTHCHLLVEKGETDDVAYIIDLGTSNGTIVGNIDLVKDEKYKLNDLDMIALASGDQGVVLQYIKIVGNIDLSPSGHNAIQLSNKRKVLNLENDEPTSTLKMPKLELLTKIENQDCISNEIMIKSNKEENLKQNNDIGSSSVYPIQHENQKINSDIEVNHAENPVFLRSNISGLPVNDVEMSNEPIFLAKKVSSDKVDSMQACSSTYADINVLPVTNIKEELDANNFMVFSQSSYRKEEDSIIVMVSSDEEDCVKNSEIVKISETNSIVYNFNDLKQQQSIQYPHSSNENKPILCHWNNVTQISSDEDEDIVSTSIKFDNNSILISSDEDNEENSHKNLQYTCSLLNKKSVKEAVSSTLVNNDMSSDDDGDDKYPPIIDALPLKNPSKRRIPKALIENENIMKTRAKCQKKNNNKKKTELLIAEQNKVIAQERRNKLMKLCNNVHNSIKENKDDSTIIDQYMDKPSTTDILKKKRRISRVVSDQLDDFKNMPSTSGNNFNTKEGINGSEKINSKRKVTFKQSEIINNTFSKIDNMTSSKYFALFDTVSRICKWNAVWLYEQKTIDETPPLTKNLYKMKGQFENPTEYSSIMKPLLLYENWSKITEVYNVMINKNPSLEQCIFGKSPFKNSPLFTFTIHSVNHKFSSSNPILKTISEPLWCLKCIGNNQSTSSSVGFPQNGFLCIAIVQSNSFETNATDVKKPTKSRNIFFSYVQSAKKNGSHNIQWSVELIVTRKTVNILNGTFIHLLGLHYLRSELRLFQAINYVAVSSLCNALITPQLHKYSYSKASIKNFNISFNDFLNNSQKQAVKMAVMLSISKEPNIGLIIGPPGTGKSNVICNVVITLLKMNIQSKDDNKHKVLLCAPSNEAVDVLVRRLVEIKTELMDQINFSIVRAGGSQKMDPIITDVTLDHLVKQKMDGFWNENGGKPSSLSMFSNRKEVERHILQKTDVVITTLNSCYSKAMEDAFIATKNNCNQFTVCIVDEAGQCVEPLNYVPLLLGINKLILVGDDKQLQPIVKSKVAKDHGFGISLFKRLKFWLDHNHTNDNDLIPMKLLDTQYRMHKEICTFPSKYFYKGYVKTAASVNNRKLLSVHPYIILEHQSQQDNTGEANIDEAHLIVSLVEILLDLEECSSLSIAVLTPYHKQREQINLLLGKKKISLNVNTIDSFQGSECDILLISTVRTNGIGFLDDQCRLNVALTRAKQSLIICGNFVSLKGEKVWFELLEDAKKRKLLKKISKRNLTNSRALSSIIKR